MSGQTVCTGHCTAGQKALVFIELEAGWVLELVWMFWRRDSVLLLSRFEPRIFECLLWSLY